MLSMACAFAMAALAFPTSAARIQDRTHLTALDILSMRGKTSHLKTSTYASGEEHDTTSAAPGYRPFFVAALFFAVLHLGVLMLGTSGLAPVSLVYLGGLMLALLALILG